MCFQWKLNFWSWLLESGLLNMDLSAGDWGYLARQLDPPDPPLMQKKSCLLHQGIPPASFVRKKASQNWTNTCNWYSCSRTPPPMQISSLLYGGPQPPCGLHRMESEWPAVNGWHAKRSVPEGRWGIGKGKWPGDQLTVFRIRLTYWARATRAFRWGRSGVCECFVLFS